MHRPLVLALAAVVAAPGCSKDAPDDPRFDGPMPVSFGDCAGPKVTWISGPRPLPFTPAEADAIQLAALASSRAPEPDDGGQAGDASSEDAPPPLPEAIEPTRKVGILGSTRLASVDASASLIGTGDLSSGLDDLGRYGGLLGSEAGDGNGGFGFGPARILLPGSAGLGAGGGGTGWGTIGHGDGTGRTRSAGAVPAVSFGQPSIQGDLDRAIVRRYVKRNLPKLQRCYEKQLLESPKLAGTVEAELFIGPLGRVASSTAEGLDATVASCVAGVLQAIEFPSIRGGGSATVRYPFTFRTGPDEGRLATPVELAGSPGGDPAAGPAAGARPLFRAGGSPLDTGRYAPGARNPLRAEDHALTECFRAGRQRFGAAILELRYDAAGHVGNATVHGLNDPRTRACVMAAAMRIRRTGAGPAVERCAMAFGVMPPGAMPAIDITDRAIKLEGTWLASLDDVAAAGAPGTKVPALVTAVEARVAQVTGVSTAALVLHEPLIVRPIAATPMRAVVRVLASVLAAGDDFVLAAPRGADWRVLQPMLGVPVVPVPFGTGGTWNHIKPRPRWSYATDDESAKLSLLVTRDRIWAGLTRMHDFQDVARGPSQLGKLAELLRAYKAGPFFENRADLEIAAEDDVPYGDVVNVIDAASKAGFVDWQLTDPPGLAAPPDR